MQTLILAARSAEIGRLKQASGKDCTEETGLVLVPCPVTA